VDDTITERKSAARRAFAHYLRTGHIVSGLADEPLETKFNPYHDPENGQFTFAPGHANALGNVVTSYGRGSGAARRQESYRPGTRSSGDPQQPSRIGSLSEKYETGGRGPGTVSSGKNDSGGVSYGSYQLSSKKGTASAFLKAPEAQQWAKDFQGLTPGTQAFSDRWIEVAVRDQDDFQAAQHMYIQRTHYDPVVDRVKAVSGFDLDTASDAVRNATWSTAVQHGGAAKILAQAIAATDRSSSRNSPGYQSALVDNIYSRRVSYVARLRDEALRAGRLAEANNLSGIITNRYVQERNDAQAMLKRER
jgi:hypothetical protein